MLWKVGNWTAPYYQSLTLMISQVLSSLLVTATLLQMKWCTVFQTSHLIYLSMKLHLVRWQWTFKWRQWHRAIWFWGHTATTHFRCSQWFPPTTATLHIKIVTTHHSNCHNEMNREFLGIQQCWMIIKQLLPENTEENGAGEGVVRDMYCSFWQKFYDWYTLGTWKAVEKFWLKVTKHANTYQSSRLSLLWRQS